MIPSNWKRRHDRWDIPYPIGGDELLNDLGDVVATFHIESAMSRFDGDAEWLWHDAMTIDAVRLEYARGEMPAPYARLWLDAARAFLAERRSGHLRKVD